MTKVSRKKSSVAGAKEDPVTGNKDYPVTGVPEDRWRWPGPWEASGQTWVDEGSLQGGGPHPPL